MMKKLIPLFGILLAAIVVMSTGAFTSVTADRDATISVANDTNALLGIYAATPLSTYPNGVYAEDGADGKFAINIDDLNMDATTIMNEVFIVQNNGTQAVDVTLSWTNTSLLFNDGDITYGNNGPNFPNNSNQAELDFTLADGGTAVISIAIESTTGNITDTLTFTATAN